MGNASCTDVLPFTLDDIILIPKRLSHCPVPEKRLSGAKDHFASFNNNLKAFTFRFRDTALSQGGSAVRFDLSQISALPMDLSQAKIELDDTRTYLLIQVQHSPAAQGPPATSSASVRVSTGSSRGCKSRTPDRSPKDCETLWRWNDVSPSWATVLSDVFTPRGLANPFSTNIGRPPTCGSLPSASSSPFAHGNCACDDGYVYGYSIYILNGVKAHPLLAAAAAMYAGRIEQVLMSNVNALRSLFLNWNPARNTGRGLSVEGREEKLCSLVGDVVAAKRSSRRTSCIGEEYNRNALIRSLCSVRKPATVSSLTKSTSTRGMPRETIPQAKPKRTEVAGLFSFETYQQQKSKGEDLQLPLTRIVSPATPYFGSKQPDGGHNPQKLPPLETTRCWPVPSDSSCALREGTLPITARYPCRKPDLHAPDPERESNSATSSSATPQGSSFVSPRFPVISALYLDGNLREQVAKVAQKDPTAVDVDETRMTEERMQKLKALAPQATEILPWLFVGGELAAGDRAQLKAKGITSIVNTVAFSIGNTHEDIFRYLPLYVSDSPDEPIFSLFPIVNQFIEEARQSGGKTFVHCHQGVSRSCSFVIAYIMWYEGLCYERAYDFVRARRSVCSPNPGFYVTLLLWQDHLTQPLLNKAYAYAPYPDHMVPFSYRSTIIFRSGKAQQEENSDGIHIVDQNVSVIYDMGDNYTLDPRLCYGLLLGDCAARSDAQAPFIKSYFFAGPECDPVVRQHAREEWENFIRYNFYHGSVNTTTNNRGESITYKPLPSVQYPSECLLKVEDVASAVICNVYKGSEKRCSTARALPAKTAHDSRWDDLFLQNNMIENFSKYVAYMKQGARHVSSHKRHRESQQRDSLENVDVVQVESAAMPRGPQTSRLPKQSLSLQGVKATVSGRGGLSESQHKDSEEGSQDLAEDVAEDDNSNDSSPPVCHEMEIYAYPFTDPPVGHIIDVADMEADCAYAIILPGSIPVVGAAGSLPSVHRVFIWIGSQCPVTEEEAVYAYQSSLKRGADLCLSTGALLPNPVEEVVYDGEEPDEFLLALD
uniref:Putative dual specificity protein phosphatase n=1 Tax=Trypanosoma congolense (strain IL3000) TaxID=1068625 RepID=G0UJE4_TRYCI|nr:putative dual specificity protein phosphatase [Trypanosoma congolense IL3000]